MMQSKWHYPVLIVLVGSVVYANSLQNGFTFDDWPLVANNPLVMQLDIGAIFSSAYWPERPDLGLYRPLTTASYAVNRLILGEDAWGFHLVNVGLHILNAVMVFAGMRKIFERPVAGLCALVFLLHPLQTEAVNSIAGRAELLAAFWMLIAWIGFAYGVGWRRWGLAALAMFLGCLCKEHAVMMVGIFTVVELSGFPRFHPDIVDANPSRASRFFHQSLKGILLCIAAVAVFLLVRHAVVGAVLLPGRPTFVDNPLAQVGIWERGLTALSVICRYAGLMLWPGRLSADYSFQAIPVVASIWHGTVVGGLILVVGLPAFFVLSWRRSGISKLAFGALWVLMPALPISNLFFPIGTIMAERLMYVPVTGFSVILGTCFSWLAMRWSSYAWVLALLLLTGMGTRTLTRNADWQNDQTLFASAVKVVPESAKAHFKLGNALRDAGQAMAALPHYRKASWIHPGYAEVHYNAGVIYQEMGRATNAMTSYQSALTANPAHANAWTNIGILLAQKGLHEKAGNAFERAMQLEPDRQDIKFNYALALQGLNRIDGALALYTQVLETDPTFEEAAIHLADIYVQRDEMDRAIQVLGDILEDHTGAYRAALNLATLLEKEERYEDAINALIRGAEGSGEHNDLALFAAARLYGRLGRLDEARHTLNAFLRRWKGEPEIKVRALKTLNQLTGE